MYVGGAKDPLRELESLLAGYYSSLHVHGIVEPVPDMSHHFRTWLYCTTGWSTSAGFALAFKEHAGRTDPLARFFRVVDRYKKLKPSVRQRGTSFRITGSTYTHRHHALRADAVAFYSSLERSAYQRRLDS